MVVWGTLATQFPDGRLAASKSWRLNWLGIALALYVFMADSLRAVLQGLDVTKMLPGPFNWPVFCAALALMAAPVAHMAWRMSTEPVDISDGREYIRRRRNYSRTGLEPHAEAPKR